MKIYTKTGDKGETGMLGGVRVSKSHLAIQTCGSLDETNSLLGVVRSDSVSQRTDSMLVQIQHDLFDLGSRVAACLGASSRVPEFPLVRAVELEFVIDELQANLVPLEAFILPSGSRPGAHLHLARSVCRRGERELVELMESGVAADLTSELVYLNRLGDLLFVMARVVNAENDTPETKWNVGRKTAPEA